MSLEFNDEEVKKNWKVPVVKESCPALKGLTIFGDGEKSEDDAIVNGVPKYIANNDRILEEVHAGIVQNMEETLKMKVNLEYIDWVTDYLKKHERLDSDKLPEDVTEKDKEKIDKIDIFYKIIHMYACAHRIETNSPVEGARSHSVSFRDTSFYICEFYDNTYSLSLTDAKAQINYDAIINEAIQEILEEKNDEETTKKIARGFAGSDEAIIAKIKKSKRPYDKIDSIANMILNAGSDEERDRAIFENYPKLQEKYQEISERYASEINEDDEKFSMKTDTKYINWVTNYLLDHKSVEDTIRTSNVEDKTNISKLGLFYDVVAAYAKKHGIGDRNEKNHPVKFNDVYFIVGKSEKGSVYAVESLYPVNGVDYNELIEESIRLAMLEDEKRAEEANKSMIDDDTFKVDTSASVLNMVLENKEESNK